MDIDNALNNFYEGRGDKVSTGTTKSGEPVEFLPFKHVTNATDLLSEDDLKIGFDTLKLPSKGMFYKEKIGEVVVEYLTSKDEDILTTPALIENNTMIDVLLRSKIKTKGLSVDEMLSGDKNAILVFLRATSYGNLYDVVVTDPYTRTPFQTQIDLTKLKYKEISEFPDANLHYSVFLPMRKKHVKFRILTDRELKAIVRQAEAAQEAKGQVYKELLVGQLRASIVEINGKTDKPYIFKFIDAMPALDSLTIRKKMDEVTPNVDFTYEFVSKTGGYTFSAGVSLGPDFFFPNI